MNVKKIRIYTLLFFCVLFCCSVLTSANDKAEIKNCVNMALKAGFSFNWRGLRKFYSGDYIKIPENKKILDNKLMNRITIYFERLKDPDLTFSELAKLNLMLKGKSATGKEMAEFCKLDSSERGKALVKEARKQAQDARDKMKNIEQDVLPAIKYGELYIKDDFAVWFYKLGKFNVKGVLVLRKEEKQWKIYREFLIPDSDCDGSVATEAEVRTFAEECENRSRNFSSYDDLLKGYSKDNISVMPNGMTVDYQQAEKMVRYLNLMENDTPALAQAMPLYYEACGKDLTPEELKRFAALDKSGGGKQVILNLKEALRRHRETIRNSPDDYTIKHIVLFEDCALVIDGATLPGTGKIERVVLVKKHKGEYLFHRSVSRKVADK